MSEGSPAVPPVHPAPAAGAPAGGVPPPPPADRARPLLVPALMLLALLAAAGAAVDWQPTLDEAYVYALSQHGFGAMLAYWAEDPQALVPQALLYPFAVADDAIWWLRLPSLIAFAASVALLWWTARQRYGPGVAAGAAALLAVSPLGVVHAADARWPVYAMLVVVASWGALLRAVDTGRRGWWVAYGVLVVIGMYSNVTVAFVFLAQALPVWWARRRALRPWLVTLALSGAAAVPAAVLLLGADAVNPLFRVPRPAPLEVPGMLALLVGADGPDAVRKALVFIGVALVAAAGWRLRRALGGPEARRGWLALAWFAVPLVAAFTVSQGGDSLWLPRYLIGALPGMCLLIAWSAAALGRRPGLLAGAVVAGLMVWCVAVQTLTDTDERSAEWTRAAAAARPEGAPVVFFDAEGVQAAGLHSPEFAAADGTPIIPGWSETPPPDHVVLLDNPHFERLPKGPPSAALVQRLAAGSPSGVVVLVLRPPDPESPGVAWARTACTVARHDFSTASVVRVSACRPGTAPAA